MTKKLILLISITTAGILFFSFMCVLTIIRSSKNLDDLTHLTGVIDRHRIIKHKHLGRFKTYYEDVVVFGVKGNGDDFGFTDFNNQLATIKNLVSNNDSLVADIYYDKKGKRVEENVTLHTFDLTINGVRYVAIADIKNRERKGTIFFLSFAIFLIWLTIFGVKRIKKNAMLA